MADAGLQTKVLISTTALTGYEETCLKSVNPSENVDLADITCFLTTATDVAAGVAAARRRLAQLFDSSISLSGDLDTTDAGQIMLVPGADVYISISVNVAKTASIAVDSPYATIIGTYKGIVESRDRSFDIDNPNTLDVTVQGNGPVDTTTTDETYNLDS